MVYDPNSPDPDHAGLSDIDQIKENFIKQRNFEAGTAEPSNPVVGMFWLDTYTSPHVLKMRNEANDGWEEVLTMNTAGMPKDHIADNITDSNTVHGVQQGSGNGFDADKLDGVEGAEYLQGKNAPMGHMSYDGTYPMVYCDTERGVDSAIYTKLKEYTLNRTPGSTVRVFAHIRLEDCSDGYIKIYLNGVEVSGSYRHLQGQDAEEDYTWDVTGVGNSDTIDIRVCTGGVGYYIYVSNFRILGKPYVEITYDQDG